MKCCIIPQDLMVKLMCNGSNYPFLENILNVSKVFGLVKVENLRNPQTLKKQSQNPQHGR